MQSTSTSVVVLQNNWIPQHAARATLDGEATCNVAVPRTNDDLHRAPARPEDRPGEDGGYPRFWPPPSASTRYWRIHSAGGGIAESSDCAACRKQLRSSAISLLCGGSADDITSSFAGQRRDSAVFARRIGRWAPQNFSVIKCRTPPASAVRNTLSLVS